MIERILRSTALLAGGLIAVSAQAAPLQTGRSVYMHHHHHAAHHYQMTYGHHNRMSTSYGVGSHPPRTTATGGNPGGYSTRN